MWGAKFRGRQTGNKTQGSRTIGELSLYHLLFNNYANPFPYMLLTNINGEPHYESLDWVGVKNTFLESWRLFVLSLERFDLFLDFSVSVHCSVHLYL